MDPTQVQTDPAPVLAARMIDTMSRLQVVMERAVQSLELSLELLNQRLGPAIVALAKESDLVRRGLHKSHEQNKSLIQDADLIVAYLQILDAAFNDLADSNTRTEHISFAKFIRAYGLAADRLEGQLSGGGAEDEGEGEGEEEGDEVLEEGEE